MATVARFEIGHTGFIDPNGHATQSLPAFALDSATLVPMYRAMVLTRLFDTKAVAMQRTGQLGTFASALGAEAIGVGLASRDASGGSAAAVLPRSCGTTAARRIDDRNPALLGR